MNLFFYMSRTNGKGADLLRAVVSLVSAGSLEVFPDLHSFNRRIRKPKNSFTVSLIWNPTKEDLREIGAMREFLAGTRILLILPNQDEEMVALAHRILPTYIAYVDDGVSEIVAVLDRLMKTRKTLPATLS